MKSNTVRLGDIADICSGGTPSKKRDEYWKGSIPWVSAKSMDADWLNTNLLFISEEGLKAGSKLAPSNSILLLTRGSGLFNRIPVIWIAEPLAFNQDIKCITAKSPLDTRFIYHWLCSQREHLSKMLDVTGLGAGKINTDQLLSLEVFWPEYSVRRKIVTVADSIVEKMKLNQLLNDYLTELLDAIFVKTLEDAEDWEEATLLDIANYKNGLAMQKFRPEGDDPGLPVLKIKELGQGSCGSDAERCRSDIDESVRICDGDLVFSWSGTLLLDFWAGGDAGLNQHLFKVTSDKYPSWFVYMWTKYHMRKFIALAKDRATTMGHIKRSALAEAEVLIPPIRILVELSGQMQPIVDQMIGLKVEARKLGELREALLPKLMSGKIDVSKIDASH